MQRLSSTLTVALKCYKCGKYLKETEVHFYGSRCSECVDREFKQRLNRQEK